MKTTLLVLCVFCFFGANSQIINIEQKRIKADSSGLYGNVNLNLSIQETTKNLVSISNGGHLTYYTPKSQVLLFGLFSLVKSEGQNFSNYGHGHLRYNYKVSEYIEWENFTQAQYNSLTKIDLRWLNGTGARFQLTDYDNALFFWGLLYMFEHESIDGQIDSNNDHRLSSYFSFAMEPQADVTFTSTTYVQPRIDDWGDYRILNENDLSLSITDRLSFSIRFLLSYDTDVPEQVPNLTYNLLNGLRYYFGK